MTVEVQQAVEAAVGMGIRDAERAGMASARRALEIAAHVSLVTAMRPYKVDGAELVGFIQNSDPDGSAEADELAAAIVERFRLEEV